MDGIEDSIRKYCMAVIQMVIGNRFYMKVKALLC